MNKKSIGITIFLALCMIAFLFFHYGIYRYDKLNQKTPIRINRFTGETWLLNDNGVWMNKDDISKMHEEEENLKQLAREEEIKKKDVPTVSLIPLIENVNTSDTDSQYDEIRKVLLEVIDINEGQTVIINTPVQKVNIWWKNYDKDTIKITINGHEVGNNESTLEGNYFYPQVKFNSGENEFELQTSRGTYKYFVNYQ